MRITASHTSPRRWLLLFAWMCFLVGLASAQTVRPVIAELGNPAKGRIEYYNDSLTPLSVVLQAQSFTVSETGAMSYRPLDSNIRLRLSATSFRLMPQQSYYVFYEAEAQTAPSWFVIYAAFSGFPFRTQQGMTIRLELPHTVYLLPKRSVEKSDVLVERLEFSPSDKKLILEVQNTGENFGRVQQTFVTFGKKRAEAPGFPMFPHSKRVLEIPLEQDAEPGGIVLQFRDFKIEESLRARAP